MATTTTNLGLTKPASSDPADISVINGNMDLIDAFAGAFLNRVYPVGAIYMSTVSTSPATLFGGTWAPIEDTFLLAAGSTYEAGTENGEAEHTLTENELPVVTGSVIAGSGNEGSGYGAFRSASGALSVTDVRRNGQPTAAEPYPNSSAYYRLNLRFGSGEAHNNMPPYLAVYVWKRTA